MKISGKRNHFLNLESVAMTDIVLNMFIFFFISFSLLYTFSPNRLQKLGINIPKAKHGETLEAAKQVNIYIDKKGVIFLEKEPVLPDELIEELKAFTRNDTGTKVLLHADEFAQFKYIARVLDAVSTLNLENFNIAVKKEE